MTNNDNIFALDLSFKPVVTQKGDISCVTNREAINQSLFNILKTKKGSRVGNPFFGAGIESFLFENLDKTVADSIGQNILAQISLWEPRITIQNIEVKVFETPLPGYDVSINYIIKKTLTDGKFDIFFNKLF